MTVVATGNRARTMDFQAGDVGYVEKTLLHYIENTGDTDLVFLEMFKSSFYQDLSLSQWLSHTPPELVMAHLNIDKATLDAIPRDELVIVPRWSNAAILDISGSIEPAALSSSSPASRRPNLQHITPQRNT